MKGCWAITKPGMASFLRTVNMAMQANFDMDEFVNVRHEAAIDEDNIAHIDIRGCLLDNAPSIYEKIGCTDYRSIREEIELVQNEGASAILFNVDSPGGTVAGLEEAANAIAGASVPTLAWAEGMSCSAAYYLSSACDQIAASSSADVGNIGCILSWIDDTVFMESMGFKTELITNEGADLKGTFTETPMSESQRQFLQDEVDRTGEEFAAHVSANRTVDEEVFRAGWYHGERAGELGLIDAICSRTEARNALVQATGLKSNE